MKVEDYIKSLTKERDELKETCETHAETIYLLRSEIVKLNNINKKLQKNNIKIQTELDNVNNELLNLNMEYKILENKYNFVVSENEEFKCIFNEIENAYDSDY